MNTRNTLVGRIRDVKAMESPIQHNIIKEMRNKAATLHERRKSPFEKPRN
jgi:hypothetical protein